MRVAKWVADLVRDRARAGMMNRWDSRVLFTLVDVFIVSIVLSKFSSFRKRAVHGDACLDRHQWRLGRYWYMNVMLALTVWEGLAWRAWPIKSLDLIVWKGLDVVRKVLTLVVWEGLDVVRKVLTIVVWKGLDVVRNVLTLVVWEGLDVVRKVLTLVVWEGLFGVVRKALTLVVWEGFLVTWSVKCWP